ELLALLGREVLEVDVGRPCARRGLVGRRRRPARPVDGVLTGGRPEAHLSPDCRVVACSVTGYAAGIARAATSADSLWRQPNGKRGVPIGWSRPTDPDRPPPGHMEVRRVDRSQAGPARERTSASRRPCFVF